MTHNRQHTVWSLVLLLMLAAVGCQQEPDVVYNPHKDIALTFTASHADASLRAADGKWENGDQVGIFAKEPTAQWSGVEANRTNRRYVTEGTNESAKFKPASGDQTITIEKDEQLDILAYYPFQDGLTNSGTLAWDISQQTDLSKIDLMTATASASQINASPTLEFKHQLAKLNLTINSADPLTEATIVLKGFSVKGTYNLFTGNWSEVSTSDFTPNVNILADNLSATVQALLIPAPVTEAMEMVLTLSNGKVYNFKLKDRMTSLSFEEGKSYNWTITLNQ